MPATKNHIAVDKGLLGNDALTTPSPRSWLMPSGLLMVPALRALFEICFLLFGFCLCFLRFVGTFDEDSERPSLLGSGVAAHAALGTPTPSFPANSSTDWLFNLPSSGVRQALECIGLQASPNQGDRLTLRLTWARRLKFQVAGGLSGTFCAMRRFLFKSFTRAALKPLTYALAVVVVFEEWLWDALKAQMHRLSALPAVQRMEDRLGQLPPWASLLVLLLPAAVLFPFKLLGLWALGHGHPAAGIGVFILAKLAGTGLAAYLFDLVRESARRLRWFDALYTAIIGLLARAKAWLHSQAAYQAIWQAANRWKASFRALWVHRARRSAWARRLRVAKARVRPDPDRPPP